MKDSIEKSLKRWLKNKVKVTMALVTVFLITGSIGYGQEIIGTDTEIKGNPENKNFKLENGATLTVHDMWDSGQETKILGDGNFIIKSNEKEKGRGIGGKKATIDVNNFTIDTKNSNGITGYDTTDITADNISFTVKENGIFTAKDTSGPVEITINLEDKNNDREETLTITADGQGIDNKNGSVNIYGTDNSVINITSNGTSGKKAQSGINNEASNGKIFIKGGKINITANGEPRFIIFYPSYPSGIENNSSGNIIIESTELNINSKHGYGITNSGSMNLISTGNTNINSKKDGIYNSGSMNLISTGNTNINSKKDGIYNSGNIIINSNDATTIISSENGINNGYVGWSSSEEGKIEIKTSDIIIISSTNGIQNNIGEVNITSENSIVIDTLENGIMNEKDGTTTIETDSLLIGESDEEGNVIAKSKNGIYSKGVVDIKNNENSIGKDFYIAATEKSLYTDNGTINLSTSGNINIITKGITSSDGILLTNKGITSFDGILLTNKGTASLNGNSIIIKAEGKNTSSGIKNFVGGKIELNAEKNIEIESKSDMLSNGIYSLEGELVDLNSQGNIKINSLSLEKNYGSNGVALTSSKINLNTNKKGNIEIISESKNQTRGIDVTNSKITLNSNDILIRSISENEGLKSRNANKDSRGVSSLNSTTNLIGKNIGIETKTVDLNSYGLDSDLTSPDKNINNNLKIDAEENLVVSATSVNGNSYGLFSMVDIKNVTEDDKRKDNVNLIGKNIFINSNVISDNEVDKEDDYSKYFGTSHAVKSGDGSNILIKAKDGSYLSSYSEKRESFGILAQAGSSTTIEGDTLYIDSKGKDISVSENFEYDGNNFTVSKLFNATQGIRLEGGAELNLVKNAEKGLSGVKNLYVTSSDIAVTANNSNFIFNGNSYFEGNDYLISGYVENEEKEKHLLVRPVIQAVDKGNINLSGDTTVISNTGHDGIDGDRINNVGIYAQGHTDKNNNENSIVNITGNLTVISGNDNFTHGKYSSNDIYDKQKAKEIIENSDIALMATANGDIKVNSENSKVFLIGDIIAGREGSTIDIKGGKKEETELPSMVVVGEVLAANDGKVDLDMSNGGYFVGRVDDYFSRDFDKFGDLRNDKFTKDITDGGKVTLTLGNNATWNVLGQSFVTNLNFAEGGGVVDLTSDGNALRIKNLSGEGTFNLTLNAEKKELGNMLYIYNVDTKSEVMTSRENQDNQSKVLTQKVNLTDSILELDYGEKLRFATLAESAHGKVAFEVNEVKERGINNVSFETHYEDYDVTDKDNDTYNGIEASSKKPGKNLIKAKEKSNTPTTLEVTLADEETTPEKEEFIASQNWYLTRNKEEINDGGKTILEMSRANYAGAVYLDNLNKRLGDMSFVDGKEGIWVRLRNDRVGEDSEYRLHNYMTQLGYDKPYPMEEGKGTEYRGIALEISKGDMDYKNINGDANIDRQALWLYDTNVYNNGFYSDYVFRVGRMESGFDIYGRETGAKVEGNYKNLFLGASAEYGYRMNLSEKSYFEPQVQLQYTYIDGTNYTTNQDTKVELDEIHSLIGRAGFRLGHDFYNEEGRKTTTIYAKADVNHEFLGEQRVDARDTTGQLAEEYRKYENDGTWYDIGMGASKDITPDFNVYMDVERQIGRTRDDQSWQFNLGFRYRFNEVKDLNPIVMLSEFSLKGDSYFDFDKSELKPEGKAVVKKISNELNKNSAEGTLKIEGHTDSKGTQEYNQKLSEKRAKTVEKEFKKNITTERIEYETKGYGEDKPVADNSTEDGRARNRRVEIKFEGREEN